MSWFRVDTLIDIVFRHRNREYGAYVLRKRYLRTLICSTISAIFVFLLLTGIPLSVYLISDMNAGFETGYVYRVEYLPFAPDDELEMKDLARVYLPPEETAELPPVISDTVEPEPKSDTKEIPTEDTHPEAQQTDTVSQGSGGDTVGRESGKDTALVTQIDVYPRFPGGEEARLFYLRRHVIYPKTAIDSGIQGVVTVVFIIEPNGSLTNIRIERGIGGGCDEEALRVIGKMPEWSPGKRSGRAVRVMVKMPIIFRMPPKKGS
jgi:protein TonB